MKKRLALFLIFLVSLGARFYLVGQLPSILNRDEAALAYNAYLLKETGQDEWGKTWPLSLQSFGDYKLPGYVYVLAGLFQVLPLNDTVVRLPSVVAGSMLTVLAFFFAKSVRFREPWAWVFTILVATTPVFFFYSRIAFEANLALSLFVGALALLFSTQEGKKRFIFDLMAITLSLGAVFTYNTPLLLLPFILPLIIWQRGFKSWSKWLTPILGLSLVIVIAGSQLLSLANQKSGITIFQDETSWTNSVSYRQQFAGAWQTVLGNKYAYYALLIGQNYLRTFSPNFLVNAKNAHPWHSLPGHGHLLGVVYFFGMIGITVLLYEFYLAIKQRHFSSTIKTQLSWFYLLLISLLPSVVTVDAPHATRSLLFFLVFNLFTLIGLKKTYHFIRDHTQIKKNALYITFSVLLVVFSFQYLKDYFNNYPQQQQSLRPGFAQVVVRSDQLYPDQTIAVIDEEGYQYILLAWYLKIAPERFFSSIGRQLPDKIGFSYGEKVSHYHFIAHIDDRIESEKTVINWDKVNKKWVILEF